MSASRRKGTAAETAVCGWLSEHGHQHVERRAQHGTRDRGDIAGVPGVVIEVKDQKVAEWAEWLDETEAERRNDGADYGVLVRRRKGKPDPGEWMAVMPLRQMAYLLREAGYGAPVEALMVYDEPQAP